MTYRAALKLHNGDEFLRKSDNSALRVVSIKTLQIKPTTGLRPRALNYVEVTAVDSDNTLATLYHLDVK